MGCGKATIGPSGESPKAVTNIGVAAHISGAASGAGSRRYKAAMTSAERSGIENGIWLCADHATLIDRDEVTYTAERLRGMKRQHELACADDIRRGSRPDIGADVLAIGPDVVCSGDILEVDSASWKLCLTHFVIGDRHRLVSFIDSFPQIQPQNRYVLSNQLGDGRAMSCGPRLATRSEGLILSCPIRQGCPRVDVTNLGTDLAIHPDTGDLYIDSRGDIARVSGASGLLQHVQSVLSMQQGENPFHRDLGTRFFEYTQLYAESPWLGLLVKLDVIRLASIPFRDQVTRTEYTPLRCVTRVYSVEILPNSTVENRLSIKLYLEVKGLGRWQGEILACLPTEVQMAERTRILAQMFPTGQNVFRFP